MALRQTSGPRLRERISLSEDSIARAFTRKFGRTLRYDHEIGAWFEWSFSHWKQVKDERAFHFARELTRQLSNGKRGFCRAGFIAGVERLAAADRRHAVMAEIWDRDAWLLATPAGTIDLRSAKLRSARNQDLITKVTGCSPGKGRPERWLKFLDEATGGDIEMKRYLQRIAGYCLTGDTTEQALFFLHGPGGNGKSVFLNILAYILGDHAVTAHMEMFTKSKICGHPAELAMLRGARMVIASETEEGLSWAESRIKSLTGGDRITARFMRQNFFSFIPQFKLLFAGNHQPLIQSVDNALRRRFQMLPFLHQPTEPDPRLEEKLKREAPQILAWAMEGCRQWQEIGLAPPESVIAATSEYFDEQDTFGQWLTECCDRDSSYSESPLLLFRSWSKFANDLSEDPGSMVAFTGKLKRVGMRRTKTGGLRFYKGLRLKFGLREGGQSGSAPDR
jgi:putative DNA primase/helicase